MNDFLSDNKRHLKRPIVLFGLFLFIASGFFVYYYNKPERRAIREFTKVSKIYQIQTPDDVNFPQTARALEGFLNDQARNLSATNEGIAKLLLADSLSEVDLQRSIQLKKAIALEEGYPPFTRAIAINYIVDAYDTGFFHKDFAKDLIFSGKDFEKFLSESNGDERLALRKLNEWSNTIYPNSIASFRIAKWYSERIFREPAMSQDKKGEIMREVNKYISSGDSFLPQLKNRAARLGLAYELKARALHLAGKIDEADIAFQKALNAYDRPPRNIFQIVHKAYSKLYYASFLYRHYELSSRSEEIINMLRSLYAYLSTPQEPAKKNVGLVAFLIEARDSESDDYPFSDFTKRDIEAIGKIYPEFGILVSQLSLSEYVKGHPLESQLK